MARPIIKWVGGKSRLLPDLAARLPLRLGRYFEPFAGGAALCLDLAPERPVLGDLNADLIAMYRAVAEDVGDVIGLLEHLAADHSEERYYQIRDEWNARILDAAGDKIAQAGAFIYLNRACFNGLWRVNRAGLMNSPWGKRTRVEFDYDNMRTAARVLRRADLRAGDYRETVRDARAGDVVYFDPPYDPVTPTASFTSYTADAFGPADQRLLGGVVRDLADRGVHVVVSNSDTPLIREIYSGLQIDSIGVERRVAADEASRARIREVIVVAAPRGARAAVGQLALGGAA